MEIRDSITMAINDISPHWYHDVVFYVLRYLSAAPPQALTMNLAKSPAFKSKHRQVTAIETHHQKCLECIVPFS